MKLLEIHGPDGPAGRKCAEITSLGLRGKDDLVTVIDRATLAFCLGEGKNGLCTAKFKADLIVDELVIPEVGSHINWGTCEFTGTNRQKHCYPGCGLDPATCRLNGCVLFLKVRRPGRICIGNEVNIHTDR